MEQTFYTKDLGIAAALLTLGIKMKKIKWDQRIAYFEFENKNNECSKYAHNYNFGRIMVNAKTYHLNLRMLKRELFVQVGESNEKPSTT